ncbi:HNH endonuclease [Actinokineospora enzanensis]|uniref:HNH endonuclease n=1 Tax=Actinokineospora enzanensis TaxID=155975 RepID=UPI003CCBC223
MPGLPDDAQVDHQIPKSAGGHGSEHNGAVACRECNNSKGDKPLSVRDSELRAILDDE